MNFKPIKHHRFVKSLNCLTSYNLSDSCCESLNLQDLLDLSSEELPSQFPLNYASLSGHYELRQAIANLYSDSESADTDRPEQVTVFCGAQEALFAAFNAVLESGDEVIIPTPCYPSLLEMPPLIGAKPVKLPLLYEKGWRFAIEDFEQRITAKTKMIVINSPHNPSGALASREFSMQLLDLVRQKDIYLLSDDVSIFSDFNQIGLEHKYLEYDKTIVIGVLSKSFGLGGVRIGWSITPSETVRSKMITIKGYGSICCSAFDEYLARIAIDNVESITQRNNTIIRQNIDIFEDFLREIGGLFEWHKPRGGIMTLIKTRLDIPLHQFAQHVAQAHGILMLPGDLFGLDGDYFRLGLGRKNLPRVLARLKPIMPRI